MPAAPAPFSLAVATACMPTRSPVPSALHRLAVPPSSAAKPKPTTKTSQQSSRSTAPPPPSSGSGGAASGSAGAPPTWAAFLTSGAHKQWLLLAAHLLICVTAVVGVQPLDRLLAYRAYFLCLRTAVVAFGYKVSPVSTDTVWDGGRAMRALSRLRDAVIVYCAFSSARQLRLPQSRGRRQPPMHNAQPVDTHFVLHRFSTCTLALLAGKATSCPS